MAIDFTLGLLVGAFCGAIITRALLDLRAWKRQRDTRHD